MKKNHSRIDILPQKAPFLFIDDILLVDDEKIECVSIFKKESFFYKGHFPQNPITPGVLLIECMAQSAQLLQSIKIGREQFGYLVQIEKSSFHQIVKPESIVRVVTTLETTRGEFSYFRSIMYDQDKKK